MLPSSECQRKSSQMNFIVNNKPDFHDQAREQSPGIVGCSLVKGYSAFYGTWISLPCYQEPTTDHWPAIITRPEESYRVSNCMCDHRNPERGPMFQVQNEGKMNEWIIDYLFWLRTGRPGDRGSIPGRGERIFRLAFVSRPALKPTLYNGYQRFFPRSYSTARVNTDHWPSSAWMSRSYTSSPLSPFMACSGTALAL
jgi:hypothetical protein